MPVVCGSSTSITTRHAFAHRDVPLQSPQDKLACLLNSCFVISGLLRAAAGGPDAPGADDFLPALIYVRPPARDPIAWVH